MARANVLIADVAGQLRCNDANNVFSVLGDRFSKVFRNVNVECTSLGIGVSGTDLSMRDWIKIARVIYSEYNRFDGFVIWHPTETLTYTASALSFVFENLAKPIVVTGSILSLHHNRTDAIMNLFNSIDIAAYPSTEMPRIPEVVVCFGGKVLRAVRARQVTAFSYAAFDSPTFPPLGECSEHIHVNRNLIRPIPPPTKRFALNDRICEAVIRIDLFPGFNLSVMREVILKPEIKGIVLGLFGAGNIPSNAEFLNLLREATEQGKVIISVPATIGGGSSVIYSGEVPLAEKGVIRISDLTPEVALTKLAVTLGRGLSPAQTRELLQYDLRGEQENIKGNIEDLWTPPLLTLEPAINVVNEVNDEVLRSLKQHPNRIYDLSARQFEVLVAEIFRHHGYQVTLTPKTRDGGFDFRALFIDGLGLSFLSYVEAKRYSADRPVGVGVVRSLHGIVAASDASRGIIVTSSRFTAEARMFQSNLMDRVSLHDYDDLKRWLEEIP